MCNDYDRVSAGYVPRKFRGLLISCTFRYILCGATLFSRWEAWGVLDGSYFCFISLTSIGFGDIVPGTQVVSEISSNKQGTVEMTPIPSPSAHPYLNPESTDIIQFSK